jgi:hypothetical protein
MTSNQLRDLYKALKSAGNAAHTAVIERVVPDILEDKPSQTNNHAEMVVVSSQATSTIADALKACERCESLRAFVPNDQKRMAIHYANGH